MRDNGGQKLAYVYYEDEPGRRSAAKLLTKDEAWRIAAPDPLICSELPLPPKAVRMTVAVRKLTITRIIAEI